MSVIKSLYNTTIYTQLPTIAVTLLKWLAVAHLNIIIQWNNQLMKYLLIENKQDQLQSEDIINKLIW